MIEPTSATIILIAFIVLYGVAIPILDVKAKNFMSLRWASLVVLMAMGVGALLDFDHLSDDCRKVILLGVVICVPIWIALRTIEKLAMKGYVGKITARKGDASVDIDLKGDDSCNSKTQS